MKKKEGGKKGKGKEKNFLQGLLRPSLGIGNVTFDAFYWLVQSQGQSRVKQWGNRLFLFMRNA